MSSGDMIINENYVGVAKDGCPHRAHRLPGRWEVDHRERVERHGFGKIVDNHWVNNPILRLLDEDGTAPLPKGIWEFTGRFRQTVLDAITAYAPSANFIFTHAGLEGDERSLRTFQQIVGAAEACDAV